MELALKNYKNAPVVLRFANRHEVSLERAQELFEKMKQFLANYMENPQADSPSREIDEIWHMFILHTKDYAEFCSKYFGMFLHHLPCDALGGKDCTTTQEE